MTPRHPTEFTHSVIIDQCTFNTVSLSHSYWYLHPLFLSPQHTHSFSLCVCLRETEPLQTQTGGKYAKTRHHWDMYL